MQWATAPIRFFALAALYLALAGQTSTVEIIAGAGAGLAATVWSLLLRHGAERQYRLRPPWHRILPRIAFAVLRDTAQVARAIAAGEIGSETRQPFAAAGDDPAGRGRLALAILFASVAPNGYVTDCRPDALALHRLAGAPPAEDRRWAV